MLLNSATGCGFTGILLQGYASLGQTQRVHLIELQVLYRAAVIIYHSNASCSADNMLAFVEVIDVLVRRSSTPPLEPLPEALHIGPCPPSVGAYLAFCLLLPFRHCFLLTAVTTASGSEP